MAQALQLAVSNLVATMCAAILCIALPIVSLHATVEHGRREKKNPNILKVELEQKFTCLVLHNAINVRKLVPGHHRESTDLKWTMGGLAPPAFRETERVISQQTK